MFGVKFDKQKMCMKFSYFYNYPLFINTQKLLKN